MPNWKQKNWRNEQVRKLANGQACQHCQKNDGTTVLAHEDGLGAGKGMGLKSPDSEGAYLCSECHRKYDNHLPPFVGMDRDFLFHRAAFKTRGIWLPILLPEKK